MAQAHPGVISAKINVLTLESPEGIIKVRNYDAKESLLCIITNTNTTTAMTITTIIMITTTIITIITTTMSTAITTMITNIAIIITIMSIAITAAAVAAPTASTPPWKSWLP